MSKLLENIIRSVLLTEAYQQKYKNCKDLQKAQIENPSKFTDPGDNIQLGGAGKSMQFKKLSLYAFQVLDPKGQRNSKKAGAIDGFNAIICLNLHDPTNSGINSILQNMYKQNVTEWMQPWSDGEYVILRSPILGDKQSQKIDHWVFTKENWNKLVKPRYTLNSTAQLKVKFIRAISSILPTAIEASTTAKKWNETLNSTNAKTELNKLTAPEILAVVKTITSELGSVNSMPFVSEFEVNVQGINFGTTPVYSVDKLHPDFSYPEIFKTISSTKLKNQKQPKYEKRIITYPYNIPDTQQWVYKDPQTPGKVFMLANLSGMNFNDPNSKVVFWITSDSKFEISMQGSLDPAPSIEQYGFSRKSNRYVPLGSDLENRLMAQAKATGDIPK